MNQKERKRYLAQVAAARSVVMTSGKLVSEIYVDLVNVARDMRLETLENIYDELLKTEPRVHTAVKILIVRDIDEKSD